MKLSVVTTLYRSAPTLAEFYRRILDVSQAVAQEVELVIVNDGSPDNSLELALALQQTDSRLVVIDLARNFGHHKAMMTGLAHASGDMVFLIDCDLEEQPEDLARFYQRLSRGDCDVVYGVQESRRGGILERATGALFFALVKILSDEPLPRNLVTSRLMTRQYVSALVRHRDREFLIAHLWHITGFRQQAMTVRKLSLSPSTYTVRQRIELAVKHVTTTSTRLLHFVLYAGLSIFALSIGVAFYYLVRYFTSGIGVSGFTSLIISIWFLGGFTVLILGILGIYLANIMTETKRRPYTIIRSIHRASGPGHSAETVAVESPMSRADPGA